MTDRKRYLMAIDPEAPGFLGIWNGEHGEYAQRLLQSATAILGFLAVWATISVL